MLFECECGIRIDCKPPLYCRCGRVHGLKSGEMHYRPSACQHRSQSLGKASCGCGFVYSCTLLGKLCGDSVPVDEWADFKGTFLNAENYQNCGACGKYVSATTVIQDET